MSRAASAAHSVQSRSPPPLHRRTLSTFEVSLPSVRGIDASERVPSPSLRKSRPIPPIRFHSGRT